MLGGKDYGAVGDYGCWVQSKTINYGRYPIKHQREKRAVDDIQLEDTKYSLFGLYIGMNKNQAMNVVKSKGWKFEKQSASFCNYTKGYKTLCFEFKNNKLTSIGFYTSPNYY